MKDFIYFFVCFCLLRVAYHAVIRLGRYMSLLAKGHDASQQLHPCFFFLSFFLKGGGTFKSCEKFTMKLLCFVHLWFAYRWGWKCWKRQTWPLAMTQVFEWSESPRRQCTAKIVFAPFFFFKLTNSISCDCTLCLLFHCCFQSQVVFPYRRRRYCLPTRLASIKRTGKMIMMTITTTKTVVVAIEG